MINTNISYITFLQNRWLGGGNCHCTAETMYHNNPLTLRDFKCRRCTPYIKTNQILV